MADRGQFAIARDVPAPRSPYATTLSSEEEPQLPAIPSLDSSDPSAPLLAPAYEAQIGPPVAAGNDAAQSFALNQPGNPLHPVSPQPKSPSTTEASSYMAAGSAPAASSSLPARSHINTTYSSVQPTASAVLRSQGGNSLPLVSGPPPVIESEACRTCGKKFIPLIRRQHTCQHCGYQYCSDHCADSALMPRRAIRAHRASSANGNGASANGYGFGGAGPSGSGGGSGTGGFGQTLRDAADEIFGSPMNGSGQDQGGFEVVEVCGHCAPNLQVTSGNTPYLRSLPLKRLQAFCKAYNISTAGNIEKEDFVQSILRAKNKSSGCLPPDAESYYRRRSVPKQGLLPPSPAERSAAGTPRSSGPSQARPARPPPPAAARPNPPQARAQPPRSAPSPSTTNGHSPHRTNPQAQSQARPAQTAPTRASALSSSAKPAAAKPKPKPTPPPPVPTIQSLVPLPASYISSLSIGTLKAILYENHVKVDYSQVLEKAELAKRVTELCKEERRRLERQAQQEAVEEAAAAQGRSIQEQLEAERDRDPNVPVEEQHVEDEPTDPSIGTPPKHVPTGPQAVPERDGICVICQEEDAQLAVVDCGHLCMCIECSKLVMATSRECPLCRTRIVTEQRLIRIFRT